MENRVKFIKNDIQEPNELKHYGVLGMKWGVRKEDDRSSLKGPISNKYYSAANKKFFKEGIKKIKASSSSVSSTKSTGSKYVLKFDKIRFDKVKAWKKSNSTGKSGGGKGGGSKKSTETTAKAEEALKEKIASAKKAEASGKSDDGGKASGGGKGQFAPEALSKEELKDNNLVSVDPDFNEKFFTTENKLGNTKFYAYKNDDGVWVISDKDKKWVLPEGLEIDKEHVAKKLEEFETALKEIVETTGYEYTEKELDMWTTAAINKIISELKTPQQKTMELVAAVINNLLDDPEAKGNADYDIVPVKKQYKQEETITQPNKEYEDRSSKTKIDDKVINIIKELEEKKKR